MRQTRIADDQTRKAMKGKERNVINVENNNSSKKGGRAN
jgi:hypothetical protein